MQATSDYMSIEISDDECEDALLRAKTLRLDDCDQSAREEAQDWKNKYQELAERLAALEGKKNEDSFKTPTPKKLFTPEASPLPSNASASPSGEVDVNMPKQSAMPPPPPPKAAVTKACPPFPASVPKASPPAEGAKASVPKPCPPKASPPGLMVATVAEDSADTLKDGEEAIAEELDLNHEDRRTVVSIVPCLFLNILFRMLFFL